MNELQKEIKNTCADLLKREVLPDIIVFPKDAEDYIEELIVKGHTRGEAEAACYLRMVGLRKDEQDAENKTKEC